MNISQIPIELGYRMPAEWEKHEATWLAWPHDRETWPNELEQIEAAYLEIIGHLSLGEKVHILVEDAESEQPISKKLKDRGVLKNIFFHIIKTNSLWVRDYGPTFITKTDGPKSLVSWRFNAWGGKYPFEKDSLVAFQIAEILNVKPFEADLILEGGSVDVNGEGVLMATEECLLNLNRNPHLNQEQIEQLLKDYLGVKKIIWLGKGIEGDDTDGHIDEVARFVAVDKIVMSTDSDTGSYNHKVLKENKERLKRQTDQHGKPFQLIELPMPAKIKSGKFALPASYTNFYIGNSCVLIPVFNDPNDSRALGILKDLFPDRNAIGIPGVPLIYGQGAIHCMTQQEPIYAA